jgi:hypothetical protein
MALLSLQHRLDLLDALQAADKAQARAALVFLPERLELVQLFWGFVAAAARPSHPTLEGLTPGVLECC